MFFAFFRRVTGSVSASCEAQVAHFEIDAFLQFQRSDEALPARHFHFLRHDEVTRSDGTREFFRDISIFFDMF